MDLKEFYDGIFNRRNEMPRLEIADVIAGGAFDREIEMHGAIHSIRDMSGFSFLLLRKRDGVVQCVYRGDFGLEPVSEECAVLVTGVPVREDRAPNGFELVLTDLKVLSPPAEALPVPVSKWKLNLNMDTAMALRPITLRNCASAPCSKSRRALPAASAISSRPRASRRFTRRRS
jgi:nondiscriminating aspartyl-tRNA synthetase